MKSTILHSNYVDFSFKESNLQVTLRRDIYFFYSKIIKITSYIVSNIFMILYLLSSDILYKIFVCFEVGT